jgi:hypothetical protein
MSINVGIELIIVSYLESFLTIFVVKSLRIGKGYKEEEN